MDDTRTLSTETQEHRIPDNAVFFDGVCVVCNGWVNHVMKRDRDRTFKFGTLQSDAGEALIKRFPDLITQGDYASVVLFQDGDVYFRSTAILRVMSSLPGWNFAARVLLAVPVPIRDFFYGCFGRIRYRLFGKFDYCRIPTEDERERFIV